MVGCHDVTPNPTNTSGSVNKVWMRKVRPHDHVTTHQGLQLGGWGDRHSSRVEAKKPALLSSRDGYL